MGHKYRAQRCNPWVANATRFYSVATNFSRLVARLAPEIFVTFFGKTYTKDILLSKVKDS